MEFITELTVWNALLIVVVAIVLDAVIGALTTLKSGMAAFDIRMLPQFVATNIFPYVGGLVVLALVAEFIGNPYDAIFYPVAAAVAVKYIAEIKDKVYVLFGIQGGE